MPHPNILYLHSHDTGRYVQPYGYAIPTPNIQQLADEGVVFRQAFCAASTCSASRACLLTGQYAHANGMLGLARRGWSLNDYRHLLPVRLEDPTERKNGCGGGPSRKSIAAGATSSTRVVSIFITRS
jgi:arylsulfatase A-like enzyme